MERLMDIGARRLGLDPADIRRRNFVRPEDMPYRPGLTYKDGVAVTYDPGDFPAAFERALALCRTTSWRARQTASARAAPHRRRPRLLRAGHAGSAPTRAPPSASTRAARSTSTIGVTAQGQGHATTLAQIAAAELGAAWEDVQVNAGDTAMFPFGMGTGGSRVAANSGPAVAQTAREVRERATRVAAEMLECAPEDVRIEQSRVHVVGMPHRAVSLGKARPRRREIEGAQATGEPGLHACTYFYPDTVTWAFGTQAAAVEVDVETCEIRLLAYAIVHDRPRDQSRHRRGAAAGRRGAGHRRRAHGRSACTTTRAAPHRQPDGLRDPEGRPAPVRSRSRSTTRRRSTRSASRASAKAAPSRGGGHRQRRRGCGRRPRREHPRGPGHARPALRADRGGPDALALTAGISGRPPAVC